MTLLLSLALAASSPSPSLSPSMSPISSQVISPPPIQAGPTELAAELVEVRKKPESAERWLTEAKLLFHSSKYVQDANVDQALTWHTEARDLAKKAMDAEPKNVWAMMWWCANYGKIAQLRISLRSLLIVSDIEPVLVKAKETDSDMESGLPYRALGRLYDLAPAIISVGSSRKARENLETAYAKFPTHPSNQIYLSEFLLSDGGKENKIRARQLAQDVVRNPRLKDFKYEALDWYEMAMHVLKETEETP